MTLKRMKSALKVITVGDIQFPEDHEEFIAALEMALQEVASSTTALKLLTANSDSEILKRGPSGAYIRMPELPNSDSEELDIDSDLVPAVVRILASYVSEKKYKVHKTEAASIMYAYEKKVDSFLNKVSSTENII